MVLRDVRKTSNGQCDPIRAIDVLSDSTSLKITIRIRLILLPRFNIFTLSERLSSAWVLSLSF